MENNARFKVLAAWQRVLTDMRIEPSHLAALANLPTDLFQQNGASLSPVQYCHLWQQLERLVGNDELPLRIGQAISIEAFEPGIFAAFCSPNLNIALPRLAEFKRLIGPFDLRIDINPHFTRATHTVHGFNHLTPPSMGMTELVFLTQLVRMATGEQISPLRVEVKHMPDNLSAYRAFFGTAPREGGHNRIDFSPEVAELPFIQQELPMWTFFNRSLSLRFAELADDATVTQRTRALLLELLPSGQASIDEVALRQNMSKRSLQRYLKEEGYRFQTLLNNLRNELAQHYLRNSHLTSHEISYLLGFQDSNSFIRAFSQWTGRPPITFRKGKNC